MLYLNHLAGLYTTSILLLTTSAILMVLAIIQVIFFLRMVHSGYVTCHAAILMTLQLVFLPGVYYLDEDVRSFFVLGFLNFF